MPPSERTCISCRKKGVKGELIKLANTPQGVIIDYSERLPGRGAYICPDMRCIDKGLKGGSISRAFKGRAKAPVIDDFIAELKQKVDRKIVSLLGMARKSGAVAAGFDHALDEAARYPGGIVIMACDLSGNTRRKAMEHGPELSGRLMEYTTKDILGSILGMDPVGIVFIRNKELSDSLKKEISRLTNISMGVR